MARGDNKGWADIPQIRVCAQPAPTTAFSFYLKKKNVCSQAQYLCGPVCSLLGQDCGPTSEGFKGRADTSASLGVKARLSEYQQSLKFHYILIIVVVCYIFFLLLNSRLWNSPMLINFFLVYSCYYSNIQILLEKSTIMFTNNFIS